MGPRGLCRHRVIEKLQLQLQFNYHVDTIHIISDKAIIPRLTEWIQSTIVKLFRTIYGRYPYPPLTTKRGVMHFLTTEVFDCKYILSLIDQGAVPLARRVTLAVATLKTMLGGTAK